MYLKHVPSGDFVEVMGLSALFDPCEAVIEGRIHAGEELQEPAEFNKASLVFPSGEGLPRCWTDAGYRARLKRA